MIPSVPAPEPRYNKQQASASHRPGWHWWLLGLAILLSLMHIRGVWRILTMSSVLVQHTSLILPVEFVAHGVWALIFGYAAANLLHTKRPRVALATCASFVTYSGVRLLLFTQADYDLGRGTLIVLISVTATFSLFFLRGKATE